MQHTANTDHAASSNADAAVVAAQRIEELEQALARAQSLYEQAPCGYLSIDADLRVVNINQTLKNWLGVPEFDQRKKPRLLHFIEPEWHDAIRNRMAESRS